MKKNLLIRLAFLVLFCVVSCSLSIAEENKSVTVKPVSKYEAAVFVNRAANYARSAGKETALREFMNPNGEFRKGKLYIFAYDFKGTVLVDGGQPELIGTNMIDVKDSNDVEVIKELIKLAQQGGGWLRYLWPNPAAGGKIEPKLGYVLKVDNDWFVGSGFYEAETKK